jgi:hypothetical protein
MTSPITLLLGYFPDESHSSAGKKFERSRSRGAESSVTTQGSTASTFSCGKPIVFVSILLTNKIVPKICWEIIKKV